ncbi:MAG: acyclic terpene utilization AtuA family protein [Pseudomonadota bacterium]
MAGEKTIRVGGASGYWGESDMALPQFLAEGGLDYIVFDYLAEITMSIMARARAKDPNLGYATDFISSVLKPNLRDIARQRVKILSNAGGVNPIACGKAVEALIADAGLDLKVAVVIGDDLLGRTDEIAANEPMDMFSGDDFPEMKKLASVNAYLGAFPIAEALSRGADIVITGRSVDSAVTLGACIHAFGWAVDSWDLLASGSLAGHILECGPQATGGNYTDWEEVSETLHEVGYPIAEIEADGSFTVTKPADTGGTVTVGTVGEQMLYEIACPQSYVLPDVTCDFSEVELTQTGKDRVHVSAAQGYSATDTYKVCATYADGWRAGTVMFFYGDEADKKARSFGNAAIARARKRLRAHNMPDYPETLVELIGDESVYGAEARAEGSRSVAVKVAAKHEDQKGAGLLLKELTGLGLAAPPGLSGFAGNRAKPSPVLKLYSFLIPKEDVPIHIEMSDERFSFSPGETDDANKRPANFWPHIGPEPGCGCGDKVAVPLVDVAWARSGDKGNKANIGIFPRTKAYAPFIWETLDQDEIRRRFAHYQPKGIKRYYLPGTGAMNIVLNDVLGGGGVASLRNDPQGKGYSQILLQTPIQIPRRLIGRHL